MWTKKFLPTLLASLMKVIPVFFADWYRGTILSNFSSRAFMVSSSILSLFRNNNDSSLSISLLTISASVWNLTNTLERSKRFSSIFFSFIQRSWSSSTFLSTSFLWPSSKYSSIGGRVNSKLLISLPLVCNKIIMILLLIYNETILVTYLKKNL